MDCMAGAGILTLVVTRCSAEQESRSPVRSGFVVGDWHKRNCAYADMPGYRTGL
jgi:hypothetical protein